MERTTSDVSHHELKFLPGKLNARQAEVSAAVISILLNVIG
jgi:hypothetical protein